MASGGELRPRPGESEPAAADLQVLRSERQLELLRNRAVIATGCSFTVSDPGRPDNPLVWVNPSFTRLTGYGVEEATGRNCRFLQGSNTDRQAVERIGRALEEGRASTEVLLNYRKDGSAFWNELWISPVHDDAGRLVNFVGVQTDVTERVTVEHERRLAQQLGCARQAILQARAQPGRGHHVDLASHPDHGGTVVVLHLQADQRSVLAHVGGAGCGGIGGRGSR